MNLRTSNHVRKSRLTGSLCDQAAFSLLEMLVAASLLVVIMLGLLAMFYQTERAFRLGLEQRDILTGGRAVMELVARDLQEVRSAGQVGVFSLVVGNGYPGLEQDISQPDGTTRLNVMQPIYFLTRENDLWKGFRYDFLPSETASGAAMLYRMQVPPAPSPLVISNEPAFLDDFLNKSDVVSAGPAYGQIVDGVVHLQILAYDALGNLITDPASTTSSGPVYDYGFEGTNLPAFVEIELGILEPKTLERFRAFPTTQTATNFLANQAAKVHIFRQMIPIRSTPVTYANR